VMKPYLFSALRDGNGLTLSGAAPSAEARASLIEAARQAGLVVVDRISINSGEPSGFAAMAAHGLAQLAKLGQGRFTLTDNNYALEGDAPDFASQDSVQAALRALPAGAIAGAMNLNPPVISPFGFSLAREAGAIVLRGVFPDEASREQALEKLRALYPGMEIRAEARIARGAPAGFAGLVNAAIEAFSKLTSGGVAFNGDALSVTGASGSTLASLMQTLSGLLPQGVRLDVVGLQAAPEPAPAPVAPPVAVAPVAVAPAPVAPAPAAPVLVVPVQAATAPPANAAPACTADAGGVIARADVYFDSGKSTPKPEAAAELARIAGILQACAGTNALASGHTDGAGNRAPNLRLSTQRARVVARMLVKEGAPARRVATISYAWDSPATSPEASESDRARNRRVEILVRQGSN
jgi:outer membrane protein OmpA-like peptidoglycan-associated protein